MASLTVTQTIPDMMRSGGSTPEPHALRRRMMLDKYGPQIRALYGNDPATAVKAVLAATVHIACACALRNSPVWVVVTAGWVLGGCFSNHLMAAMHELVHCLALRRPAHNRALAMVINCPLALPAAVTFKKYHNEHHSHQGVEGIDMDLPTWLESHAVKGSMVMKLCYCIGYMLVYCVRPLALRPHKPGMQDLVNWVIVLTFDALLATLAGWRSLLYLVAASTLGAGLHPLAGHLLAEHVVFVEGQETYSYYGPANTWMYNVGYHNEHHDFPQIPGSRLPQLRAIAPEFYDSLAYHTSYTWVLWKFVTDDAMGPWRRVRRAQREGEQLHPAMGVKKHGVLGPVHQLVG